jgi:hypothetical protein
MLDSLAALRLALSAARKRSRLYPPHLRDAVLRLASGLDRSACSRLAKQLDLPLATLRYWLDAAPAASSFLPVVVRSSAPASLHTLLLPGGARVERLSLDDLAALCRKVAS